MASGLIVPSSARRTCSNAYMVGWRDLIVRLRQLRLTADEIGEVLGFPRSTLADALKVWGLNRLGRLTPPEPIRRCERDAPGDLLHLDIKKLGRFNKTGHRVTGHHRRKRSKASGLCACGHRRLQPRCLCRGAARRARLTAFVAQFGHFPQRTPAR